MINPALQGHSRSASCICVACAFLPAAAAWREQCCYALLWTADLPTSPGLFLCFWAALAALYCVLACAARVVCRVLLWPVWRFAVWLHGPSVGFAVIMFMI